MQRNENYINLSELIQETLFINVFWQIIVNLFSDGENVSIHLDLPLTFNLADFDFAN